MPRKCLIDSSVCGLWRPKKPEAYSVCFPSPIAIGAAGDPESAYEMASLVAQLPNDPGGHKRADLGHLVKLCQVCNHGLVQLTLVLIQVFSVFV